MRVRSAAAWGGSVKCIEVGNELENLKRGGNNIDRAGRHEREEGLLGEDRSVVVDGPVELGTRETMPSLWRESVSSNVENKHKANRVASA